MRGGGRRMNQKNEVGDRSAGPAQPFQLLPTSPCLLRRTALPPTTRTLSASKRATGASNITTNVVVAASIPSQHHRTRNDSKCCYRSGGAITVLAIHLCPVLTRESGAPHSLCAIHPRYPPSRASNIPVYTPYCPTAGMHARTVCAVQAATHARRTGG